MNNIEYRKGDLFAHSPSKLETTILFHSCNAQGVMGSGVAKTFKEKYPDAFRAYSQMIQKSLINDNAPCMGEVSFFVHQHNFITACGITQENYGRDGRRYVSYEAFFDAFRRTVDFIHTPLTVIMPKVGAGLGGGDWNIIEGLMKIILGTRINVIVIVYEL
jgi:O-acetyl-ADP-ribose deacetylase (regulator of RNase III)